MSDEPPSPPVSAEVQPTLGAAVPPRVRLFLAIVLLDMLFMTAFRAAFLTYFHDTAPPTSAGAYAWAWGVGARFDLRLAVGLCLPLLVAASLRRTDPLATAARRRGWLAYLGLTWAFVTFVHFVDFAHYAYTRQRLNATLLEHTQELDIALGMVWESYPIVWLLLAMALLAAVYVVAAAFVMRRLVATPAPPGRRRVEGAGLLAVALFAAAGIYGKVSAYPLRWSDAYTSNHQLAAGLGLNPLLFFLDTWTNRRKPYDLDVVRDHYPEVARFLAVDAPDVEKLTFARATPARPVEPRPNVVIIVLESFASFMTGTFGNPLDPTPNFDALARESLLFRRFFATTAPTARAIFSLVTSVTDVNPNSSASRNPLCVSQRTLAPAFDGYGRMYFIGGSASWGNIRGVLEHNMPELQLHEEGDYASPVNDVWGISDLHLLREAHDVFRAQTKPFLAIIQTAGNHRPWTIPEDHGTFEVRTDLEEERVVKAGFAEGLAELNSIRVMDYSLGDFFARARQEKYYENTVFFIFGDHGTSFGGESPPLPGLVGNHVPLVIHSPRLFPAPKVIDTIASSLDVMPTAAALAGVAHVNETLGRDLLVNPPPGEHYAFVRAFPTHGLVGDEFFLRLQPDGTPELFRYASDQPLVEVSKQHPEVTAKMARLCRGVHETALFMLHRGGHPTE